MKNALVSGLSVVSSSPGEDSAEANGGVCANVVQTGRFRSNFRTDSLRPSRLTLSAHLFSAGEKVPPTPAAEAIAQAFLFAGVTSVLVAADPGDATRDSHRLAAAAVMYIPVAA